MSSPAESPWHGEPPPRPDVSIVMPCLNEALCLRQCIGNAEATITHMGRELGLRGEIIVADNGSTDGSPDLAQELGARVVPVSEPGYGAALKSGIRAAGGRYIVIGDADGSYDFFDAVAMVGELTKGADLCIGSRFRGKILPGAMPWKNRYIGNPILTGILNLLFRPRISDAHCGLRAFTKSCFERLRLTSSGMEFASEMVIKAALLDCRITEVPVTLSRDLRNRPPHLRPWRDGWRHLRYLLMLSPSWLLAAPATVLGGAAVTILSYAVFLALTGSSEKSAIGNYWVIAAGGMLNVAHGMGLLAASIHLYGIREGYRRSVQWAPQVERWLSLETMLAFGLTLFACGMIVLAGVVGYWSATDFSSISNVLPAVIGTTLAAIGSQNALGGFLLAIIAGNEPNFMKSRSAINANAVPGETPSTLDQPRRASPEATPVSIVTEEQ